jgi:ketosteroid isomerase-like protein
MRTKPFLAVLFALLLCIVSVAQTKKAKAGSGPGPDKAHLQKIWDAWGTLDASKPAEFYAQGAHTFFDIAPLKYSSWDEYQKGVGPLLANYSNAHFTVNDDAEIHTVGDTAWGSSTVKSEMTTKGGKHELSTFRWTYVFEKLDGKWLVVHEHVSAPLS